MKLMKKVVSGLIVTTFLVLPLTSCGSSEGTMEDAETIANQLLTDFNSGAPVYYSENFVQGSDTASFTYERDSENNIYSTDIGVIDSVPYEYIEYRIDDVYYIEEEGVLVENTSEDYDPAAYFDEQLTVIADSIQFCAVDTFDPTIDTDFAVEGDNFIITGLYEDDSSEYTLTLSKDGKMMTYEDNTGVVTLDFNFSEKIELPN